MRVREPPLSLAADGTNSAQQPQFKKLKLTGEKRKLTEETKAPQEVDDDDNTYTYI
jgi:hypothetical protein